MNFCLHIPNFNISNISLLESKQNILMEGFFTKINYLSEFFTMNGLFLYAPIKIKGIIEDKNFIKFDPYSPDNNQFIKQFSNIEDQLLSFYIHNKQKNLKKQNILSKQFYNGVLKVNIDKSAIGKNSKVYIIKISGIWETSDQIGITYKLFEGCHV